LILQKIGVIFKQLLNLSLI